MKMAQKLMIEVIIVSNIINKVGWLSGKEGWRIISALMMRYNEA
jgi:hypothetical protein